jgi:hypothetical protein
MDNLETFLNSKTKGKSSVCFVLSGIVVSGYLEDFGDGGITISEASVSGEKISAGITTIPVKNVLAWGDGQKFARS